MRYYQEILLVLLLFGIALLTRQHSSHLAIYAGMLAVLLGSRLLLPAEMFSGWLKVAWVACLAVVLVGIVVELAL